MRIAVDTNILLDLLAGDLPAAEAASNSLLAAAQAGPLVVCPVVYAEVAVGFGESEEVDTFLRDFAIQFDPFGLEALRLAAVTWRNYLQRRDQRVQCPRCGQQFTLACPTCAANVAWRQHIIADFLIGGHATAQADALLTRDAGYYRTYFPNLKLQLPIPPDPSSR